MHLKNFKKIKKGGFDDERKVKAAVSSNGNKSRVSDGVWRIGHALW